MTTPYINLIVGFAALLMIVVVACFATYLLMQRRLRLELESVRAEMADAIDSSLVSKANESAAAKPADHTAKSKPAVAIPKPTALPEPARQSAEELAHETLVVIAAAVSAFLGKSVKLRSARLIQPSEGSAWAQQGRVFVQASHNLGLAHHG